MHANEQISLERFLQRDYENERECEFVDGRLVERTGGTALHGLLHAAAGAWFWEHRDEWSIECLMSYSL